MERIKDPLCSEKFLSLTPYWSSKVLEALTTRGRIKLKGDLNIQPFAQTLLDHGVILTRAKIHKKGKISFSVANLPNS